MGGRGGWEGRVDQLCFPTRAALTRVVSCHYQPVGSGVGQCLLNPCPLVLSHCKGGGASGREVPVDGVCLPTQKDSVNEHKLQGGPAPQGHCLGVVKFRKVPSLGPLGVRHFCRRIPVVVMVASQHVPPVLERGRGEHILGGGGGGGGFRKDWSRRRKLERQ